MVPTNANLRTVHDVSVPHLELSFKQRSTGFALNGHGALKLAILWSKEQNVRGRKKKKELVGWFKSALPPTAFHDPITLVPSVLSRQASQKNERGPS